MEDNRTITDDEKKRLRRKRRVRNRIMAWIFLLIFMLIIGCGAYYIINRYWPNLNINKGPESTETSVTVSVSTEEQGDVSDAIGDLIDDETDVVVHEPTPDELAPSEEELFEAAIIAYVENMSLREKVAGLFIVYPEQITGVDTVIQAGDGTRQALADNHVGGLVYRSKNIVSADQFKTMLTNTGLYAQRPLFTAVWEELGNTVISDKLSLYKSDSQAVIGATMISENAYIEASQVADYLGEYGINLNLGIVADIDQGNVSDILKGRTFSDDYKIVGEMVTDTVKAYEEKNIHTSLAFFPGQSYANQDTSSGIAVSERTKDELISNEFNVYKYGVEAGADIILVSHVIMSICSEGYPASMSREIIKDIIRDELKFKDTIVITDFMDKAAIHDYYESGESAVKAIKAGADMILCPSDYNEAYNAVLEAVGSNVIAEQRINDSLVRIYKVKFKGKTAEEIKNL